MAKLQSSRKTKVFIYPPFGNTNAYIKNMTSSFEQDETHEILKHIYRDKPLWGLFLNLDADICIFSWIEGMCSKKSGLLKFAYIVLFIVTLRSLRKKVIWILHNKHPHEKSSALTRKGMSLLAKLSTAVVTHSEEGVNYFEQQCKRRKCYYIPHPVYSSELKKSSELVYDYVVWGEINERKGVREFVQHIKGNHNFDNKRILICGRCKDKALAESIENCKPNNVTFINRFIPDEEMEQYIGSSRYIVFTYHSSSVLSSGALIYSLNFCKPIIGPNVGSFREMAGIVTTYDRFEDIPNLKVTLNRGLIEDYINNNQWKDFPLKIDEVLRNGRNQL